MSLVDPRQRIRKISRLMRRLLLLTVVVLATANCAVWLVPEWLANTVVAQLPIRPDVPVNLGGWVRSAGFVLSWVPLGVLIYAMLRTRGLFAEYAQGRLFSTAAAERLKSTARAVLLLAVFSPLMPTVFVLLFTFENPQGQRLLYLGADSTDVMTAIVGGLLFAIALVMGEAAKVAAENEQFV